MTTTIRFRNFALVSTLSIAAACAPRVQPVPAPVPVPVPPPAPVVAKAPIPEVNPALPPVPHVTGPLEIKVVYPPANQTIQSRDSNFVFGSIGNGDAGLTVNGVLTPVWPNGSFMAWVANPPADAPRYEIVATTGLDTVRLSHPIQLAPPPPAVPPPPRDTMKPVVPALYASLIGPDVYPSDTDRVVTAYALTGGLQRWFLMPGTVVKVVAMDTTNAHVQLDSSQMVRIARADLKILDTAFKRTALRARAYRIEASSEWTDVVIPLTEKSPHLVEVGPSSLTLILYGTSGPTGQPKTTAGPAGSYLASVTSARSGDQMRYTMGLRGPAYGYLALWEQGLMRFRVRRPPAIDSTAPLRGLTIAVDPGHPPIGATGPTGLWEPVPTLAVGLRMQALLQKKGATVVMTRTAHEPVALNDRPTIARRANSHAFVSIHFNAVPDGVNPMRVHGTATYQYHPHSLALAETTQRGLVKELSLRDNGVKRDNFAVIRGTWMPSVLAEGAFIIVPDQEAAIKTPEYQERYARGLIEGLENYFRSLAAAVQR
ncbi:MAG TPA: N-acetylmuramoyl-L-alanine amidase [Gemmatimonadaceae bacterium]|nr:N-acetylmuramoyl-L-alanine amidase [Gemmatimonadaceae bacterium]